MLKVTKYIQSDIDIFTRATECAFIWVIYLFIQCPGLSESVPHYAYLLTMCVYVSNCVHFVINNTLFIS